MKNKTTKILLILGFVAGIIIAVLSIRKKDDEKLEDAPEIDPPSIADAKEILEVNDGEGRRLIEKRMRQLNASNDRADIIAELSIRNPIEFASDKGAVLEVFQDAGISSVPIIPPFLNNDYSEQVNNFLEMRPFEEIARGDFEAAKNTYKNALNLSSIGISLFPSIQKAVESNAFGKAQAAGDHERGRYWDYDNAINQIKKVLRASVLAGNQLEQGLRDTAIIELEQAGYNFV